MKCNKWNEGEPCYYCLEGVRQRRYYPGHRGYRDGIKTSPWRASIMQRRRERDQESGKQQLAALGFAFSQEFPSLFEHLSDTTFDDGSERETSTVLLFVDGGQWKACLHDRQEGLSLWVSGATYGDVMSALEADLAAGGGSWRSDRGKKSR